MAFSVEAGPDAADDWIAERAGPGAIVVTSDIPLASRCVKSGADVIAPHGKRFSESSIGMALATRDLMDHLRSTGQATSGPKAFGPRDVQISSVRSTTRSCGASVWQLRAESVNRLRLLAASRARDSAPYDADLRGAERRTTARLNHRRPCCPSFLTLYCVINYAPAEERPMTLSRYAENGVFTPAKIAGALRTTRDEIAQTAGLGRDAILRKERIASQKTQKRLREMVEILNKIEPRFGSDLIAYAWYRSEPLPGFSGQTAMQLVRAGRAADVLEYIDAVDAGVFA
jgi:Uncharacterized BCR, YaiI/YqxD family COG1671/Protein of unknown function (DUF2384)